MEETFEIWTVKKSEGFYYTLEDDDGNMQDFLKLGALCEELEEGEKVLVINKNNLRTIASKAAQNVEIR